MAKSADKSVEQLRRESEQSRAELSSTVEALRYRISETTSPDHIKAEVRGYVADKATGWVDQLKQQVMDNPLQALAAGSAIALPALRLARAIPLPMLLVGAGFALSSSGVRARASDALGPALQPVKEFVGNAAEKTQGLSEDAIATASDLSEQARQKLQGLRETAAARFDDVRGRAADAVAGVQPSLDRAKATAADLKATAADLRAKAGEALDAAPETATAFVRNNAALIGGLGLAIGAIVAASLPATKVEANAAAMAGAGARRAAGAAARSGIDAAKQVVVSAADAAAGTVKDADLGHHASRMAGNFADTLKSVAADAVTTAFEPSRDPNHSEEAGQ